MIFASDLDRTLVYSNRAIDELGDGTKMNLKPVEEKDGEWVAYMTEAAFFSLKELARQSIFIPVTTRTTEQYQRFFVFREEIEVNYAITSNGAIILHEGKPVEEWSTHVRNRMKKESVTEEELLAAIHEAGFRFDGQKKQAGKLFFYFILNSLPTALEKESINQLALKFGWRISLQGRKLYFIPLAISKGSALEYICEKEGVQTIAGAGDSILDWDFLRNCQHRFVPNHGELAKEQGIKNYYLSKSQGLYAGEEILQQFLKLL